MVWRKKRKRYGRRRLRIRTIAVWVGLLVLLGLVAETIRLISAAHDLTEGTSNLRDSVGILGTSPEGWTEARIAIADRLRARAATQIGQGRQSIRADPGLTILGRLPLARDQVTATPARAAGAAAAAAAAADEVTLARAYGRIPGDQGTAGTRMLHLIEAGAVPLANAQGQLEPSLLALLRDRDRPLITPLAHGVQAALDEITPRYEQVRLGAAAGRYLPPAIGGSGPRTYLLLLPNPAELRPSGGFSGAAGSLAFVEGSPQAIEIKDQSVFDRAFSRRYPIPAPLANHLKFVNSSLELGDAGWDPDFPSTAALSEEMFRDATGHVIDGTISIDPYAISALLAVTGPVDVAGYGRFDAGNFFPQLDFIVNVSHAPGAGKGAIGPIAQAILRATLSQQPASYQRLIDACQEQARGRHLQVYLHDQGLARAAAVAHFDGAVLPGGNDYALVVDANIGATKSDYYLRRSMSFQAEVPASGLSNHRIVMRYDLPQPVDDVDRALNPGVGEYHDYVRFYLPEPSTVGAYTFTVDGKPAESAVDMVAIEHGRRVVGAFFSLGRGHSGEVRLEYTTPLDNASVYDLLLQKQAGVATYPVRVEVSHPGGVLRSTLELDHDRVVHVTW